VGNKKLFEFAILSLPSLKAAFLPAYTKLISHSEHDWHSICITKKQATPRLFWAKTLRIKNSLPDAGNGFWSERLFSAKQLMRP